MGSIRRRVNKLKARTGAKPPVKPPGTTTLDEIRAIEKEIAEIEAEMRAAGISEAEIRATHVEISPGEDLEMLEREIARLEAEGEWHGT